MSQLNIDFKETIPVGQLGIIPLQSSWDLGKKVNDYIVSWRNDREAQTAQISFLKITNRIPTLLMPNVPALVPAKQKVQLTNRSEAKIYI